MTLQWVAKLPQLTRFSPDLEVVEIRRWYVCVTNKIKLAFIVSKMFMQMARCHSQQTPLEGVVLCMPLTHASIQFMPLTHSLHFSTCSYPSATEDADK